MVRVPPKDATKKLSSVFYKSIGRMPEIQKIHIIKEERSQTLIKKFDVGGGTNKMVQHGIVSQHQHLDRDE